MSLEKLKPWEKIVRIRIPDENLNEWIEDFKGRDFTEEEMDRILAHLNNNYARSRKAQIVERELQEEKKYIFRKSLAILTPTEIARLKEFVEKRFDFEHRD